MIASSPLLPNFTSKIAACVFLSSSPLDSHRRRTYPVESILAWPDRSSLLLERHPTKPWSSNNCLASVGKLSASGNIELFTFGNRLSESHARKLFLQNSLRNDKIGNIELFTFGSNRLVQVLWSPEFTLPVEGIHVVVENATLVTLAR